jgi:hypothetical protein
MNRSRRSQVESEEEKIRSKSTRFSLRVLGTWCVALTVAAWALTVLLANAGFFGYRPYDPCRDASHVVYGEIAGCTANANSVNAKNSNDHVDGECLLMHAIGWENYGVAQKLIEHGANPGLCGPDLTTRAYLSLVDRCGARTLKSDPEFVLGFLEKNNLKLSDHRELLRSSLRARCLSVVRFSLDRGADPNFVDSNGLRPLNHAAALATEQNAEAIRLLLTRGADAQLLSNAGETAFVVARNRLERVKNWPMIEAAFQGVSPER